MPLSLISADEADDDNAGTAAGLVRRGVGVGVLVAVGVGVSAGPSTGVGSAGSSTLLGTSTGTAGS
ncbi:hypothetical protein [Arthrobacter woluwensis]|uniref:hypothetical protein n=1 Tax=Arthrobacter woluwensis TaxID=156980 RepID=UPI001AAFA5FD|nr:hypothetical protein [Arthrobacter woluwensis]QTF71891.1 hypothetical protein G8758_07645 [Arthrobacter woluwensis]